MIELDYYEAYLIQLWHEAGTVSQTGMGIAPLTWAEITAWADRFFTEEVVQWVKSPTKRWVPILVKEQALKDYELQIIRMLSQEYSSEYSMGSEQDRACPKEIVIEDITKEDAEANSNEMAERLLEMFGKKADPEVANVG